MLASLRTRRAPPALSAADCGASTYVDQQIDPVLTAIRVTQPDVATETTSIHALVSTLGGK